MKANLKKLLGLAALGVSLLAVTVPTWAGRKGTYEVRIGSSQAVKYASGSMVGARYSADNKQFIGCTARVEYYVNGSGSIAQATCFARDSAGKYLMCANGSIEANGLNSIDALHGMTETSYIYFEILPPLSNCNRIAVYNGSDMLK